MPSHTKRALLSVADKTGIVELAQRLQQLNFTLLSTGGTAQLLREHHITVTEVSDYTGFPEILEGRVKTLHPKIHAGLLARPGVDDETLKKHELNRIELVVVNLYPFAKTIANPHTDLATAIENIDIGGVTLLRAAAKNYAAVTTVVEAADYTEILDHLEKNDEIAETLRLQLAKKAFAHTAAYDAAIANYFNSLSTNESAKKFPDIFTTQWYKKQDLRYGENPHQAAAFYINEPAQPGTLASAEQLQGKELSYNNIADSDAALSCVKSFTAPACVIVKHANPCGVAVSENLLTAYQKAFACDARSAFGGIIAFNHTVDAKTAEAIIAQQFAEVILAPSFATEALALFKQKPAIRILSYGLTHMHTLHRYYHNIDGGVLIQDSDVDQVTLEQLKIVTQTQPSAEAMQDLLFAWKVAQWVKSNAIVFAKNSATIGIGAGQMSRVDSVELAARKAAFAQLSTQNCVMASDAFFPFSDNIEQAAKAGITAIIQPGGSIRDQEVIAAADAAKIAMVFTGVRHFRH